MPMTVRDGWPTCRMAPILSSFSNGVRSSGTAVISTTVTGLAAAAATSFISWSCAAEKVRFVASLPAETIACVQLSCFCPEPVLANDRFPSEKVRAENGRDLRTFRRHQGVSAHRQHHLLYRLCQRHRCWNAREVVHLTARLACVTTSFSTFPKFVPSLS